MPNLVIGMEGMPLFMNNASYTKFDDSGKYSSAFSEVTEIGYNNVFYFFLYFF